MPEATLRRRICFEGPATRTSSWLPACATWGVAIGVTGVFCWMLWDIVFYGLNGLNWSFLVSEPMNAGREGGIGPILVSTGLIMTVCMAVSLPIGIGTAILLAEFTPSAGRFGRAVRLSLDVLAGIPSIAFGLFGNAFFCKVLGLGFSILSGGLTLACMVLPILIRSAEEGIRLVPAHYRLSAEALGIPRASALLKLILPAAVPGLLVGAVLGLGRAMAETAALIFTSGYVDRMPTSLLDSGRSLSIHIYDLSMNVAGGNRNSYASALTLILALTATNTLAAWIGSAWSRKLSRDA